MSSSQDMSSISFALDGERKRTCFRPPAAETTWWQVDLASVYIISEVVIYSDNRKLECFADLFELMLFSLLDVNAKWII